MKTWKIVFIFLAIGIGLPVIDAIRGIREAPEVCAQAEESGIKYLCKVFVGDARK